MDKKVYNIGPWSDFWHAKNIRQPKKTDKHTSLFWLIGTNKKYIL
jgi:hypothetical protein